MVQLALLLILGYSVCIYANPTDQNVIDQLPLRARRAANPSPDQYTEYFVEDTPYGRHVDEFHHSDDGIHHQDKFVHRIEDPYHHHGYHNYHHKYQRSGYGYRNNYWGNLLG